MTPADLENLRKLTNERLTDKQIENVVIYFEKRHLEVMKDVLMELYENVGSLVTGVLASIDGVIEREKSAKGEFK